MKSSVLEPNASPTNWLPGDGEMAEHIRAFDWSKTSLGPVETWSPALRMMVRFLLANRFPLLLWWGPKYVSIYNDAYRPILGTKHPSALGQPVSECWNEIWHILQPLIDTPFQGGPATWNDDILLEINRHGFVEETHFTIAYSPVPDETIPSGIGGVLATVHEITGKVIGDRRVTVLRDLGARSSEAKTAEEACTVAAETLATHPKDIPFALLYLIAPDRKTARLAGTAGVAADNHIQPPVIPLEDTKASDSPWPLTDVLRSETMQTVTHLSTRLSGQVPSGPWSDAPHTAVVVPIHSNKAHQLAGFLVASVSARLQLDDLYRDFLKLVSSQIATSIANAREYEEEKKRAEALAEIDRAKTTFFSNVSHELRTPLTLMLGPLEDALANAHGILPLGASKDVAIAHRNSQRLLKLVNALLDFARIEARRIQAVYEPTDLPAFTAELASLFRSAIEKAGLKLIVDCPSLDQPVYIDREMWEKIVLNLLSNAFKFTFNGEIKLTLRRQGDVAELHVRDTGVGIPVEELPRVFDRFHRVPHTQSRTHEGTGIGLALVQELVKLHGGSIRVESRPGEGSTFIVSLPLGKTHLPRESIGGARTLSSSMATTPFVDEALRWLPDDISADEETASLPVIGSPDNNHVRPLLVIADDNADMRRYLSRLLAKQYEVRTVADGHAALAAARERQPDLILSDIMMPRMDGIELLRELRADSDLKIVPIILLSARAGEESRVEGLEQGADDYLIKPFSARELHARVAAHLAMARLRRESAEAVRESEVRFRALVQASSDVVYRMSADWSEMRLLVGRDFIADTKESNRAWLQKYVPADDQPRILAAIQDAVRRRNIFELEHQVLRVDGTLGWTFSRAIPINGPNGEIIEWFGMASDITERKKAENALRDAHAQLSDRAVHLDKLVQERTARLQEMVDELEHVSYAIAHDMRAPLRAMTTFAGILLQEASANANSEQLEPYCRRIIVAASRLDKLIQDALHYTKVVQQEMPLVPVDLSKLIRELIAVYPNLQADKAEIVIENELPVILGNDALVTQCFSNLLGNGVKFVPRGARPNVRVCSEVKDGKATIWVKDNGVGIPKTSQPRLFKMFQKLDNQYEGTGIGLAIVRKVVERMNGRVGVDSEPAQGSNFWVELSLANDGTSSTT